MNIRRSMGSLLPLLAVLATGLLAGSSAARAATVRVEEKLEQHPDGSYYTVNETSLLVTALPGEQNVVTVTLLDRSDDRVRLQVIDAGAPLIPGPGCSGGGPGAAPVVCSMHAPSQVQICSKNCPQLDAEKAHSWHATIFAELGDGSNSFDGSGLNGRAPDVYREVVQAGAGDDRIATGSGDDEIEAGAGLDAVHSGRGYDRALASPIPDGPDLYDLGESRRDQVSYGQRTGPVSLVGTVGGAPGEEDSLIGVEVFAGGSGDDSLEGGPARKLVGGPGNDHIAAGAAGSRMLGGPGNDVLQGARGTDVIFGGDGDDTMTGAGGEDYFREVHIPGEGESVLETTPTSGNDKVDGGRGDDSVRLGPGNDTGEGGAGDDNLQGEAGADAMSGGDGDDGVYGGLDADTLRGGRGEDDIGGEAGPDRLFGGPGNDFLLAGRAKEGWNLQLPQPVDSWADRAECGAGADVAQANPWDSTRGCERKTSVGAVGFGAPRQNPANGTVRLPIRVAGSGDLLVQGRGVFPVELRLDDVYYPVDRPLFVDVAAQNGALSRLRRDGQVTLLVVVRITPDDGIPRAAHKKVTLALR